MKPATKAILAIVAIVAVVSMAFGLFVARYFVRPIIALKRGTESVAAGDFDSPIRVQTGDEIEDLAGHFNAMAGKLGESQRRLSTWNEELQRGILEKTEDLRASEQKERLERHKIECIVGAIGAELLLVEKDLTVSWASRQTLDRLGIGKVIGRPCYEVFWGGPSLCPDCSVAKVMRDGLARKKVIMGRDQACRERFYQIVTTPVPNGVGETEHVLELRIDITESLIRERENRDQLARADKLASLGQIVAGVVHEVANPLAAMKTSIQVMREQHESSDGQAPFLDRVVAEIDRLAGFLRTFSSFSKPRKPEISKFDPREVCIRVVELLRREAQKRGITLGVEAPTEAFKMSADPSLIQQAVLDLVLNAIDATSGGGKVTVAGGTGPEGVWLKVSDTGAGISPEHLDKIFDPFYTTKPTGTGLGLAIVRQIVQEHGGRIEAASTVGQGTAFTMRFPT